MWLSMCEWHLDAVWGWVEQEERWILILMVVSCTFFSCFSRLWCMLATFLSVAFLDVLGNSLVCTLLYATFSVPVHHVLNSSVCLILHIKVKVKLSWLLFSINYNSEKAYGVVEMQLINSINFYEIKALILYKVISLCSLFLQCWVLTAASRRQPNCSK